MCNIALVILTIKIISDVISPKLQGAGRGYFAWIFVGGGGVGGVGGCRCATP